MSHQPTAILDVVGLCRAHLPRMSFLGAWAEAKGREAKPVASVLPAVTTTVQSTYLTGRWPSEHGIVGNGWYFRDECEVKLWRQSNKLVQAAKVWDMARKLDPSLTVANLFWWYAMYADVDYTVTPRPQYHSDGLKLPDIYTKPAGLREQLQSDLGQFPLFNFWGPNTSVAASQWIAEAAMAVHRAHTPGLNLVYLPHLDYNLQRHGERHPSIDRDLAEIDDVCRQLIEYYEARGVEVVVLSEYGIREVGRPIDINRALRQAGLLQVRVESGGELLDAGASTAFALADHQVAHVYVNDNSRLEEIRRLLLDLPGVEDVLDEAGKAREHLDHPRSGELVAIADAHSWFTYYYWLDNAKAPEFARCVDIHRKPGYDPVEMFVDPEKTLVPLRVAYKLARKKLGFRYKMDIIPLDAQLVRGSHGRHCDDADHGAILISEGCPETSEGESISPTAICQHMLSRLFRG